MQSQGGGAEVLQEGVQDGGEYNLTRIVVLTRNATCSLDSRQHPPGTSYSCTGRPEAMQQFHRHILVMAN